MADKGKGRVPAAGSSRQPQVPGAKVISYFTDTDGQFGNPSIGYDVERFNKAVQQIVVPEAKKQREQDARAQREREGQGKGEEGVVVNGVLQDEAGKVEVKKADVDMISSQLEISSKEAELALKRAGGDLVKALVQLTAPLIPKPQAIATSA